MKMMMIIMAKMAIMMMRLKLTVKIKSYFDYLFIPVCPAFEVMLHGTIHNDDF